MIHVPFIPSAPSTGAHPKHARRPLRLPGRLAVAIAVVGFGGCGVFESTRRVIGFIDFDDSGWPLPEVPETATAGVAFEMTIWTGETGCYSIGETDVDVTGRRAEVTPFDYVTTGNYGCTDHLAFFEHKATVVFREPGTAEIVLVYSTDWDENGDGRKVYTVEVSPADPDRLPPSSRRPDP